MSTSIMISFLSTSLDGGSTDRRRTAWRPNAGIALASEPKIDRLVLLYEKGDEALATLVAEDAKSMRDGFDVQLMETAPSSSNISATYMRVLRLGDVLQFDPAVQYYLNITTCTPIQQICFCTIAQSRRWPVKLVQCLNAKTEDLASMVQVIDLDLSRYDVILNQYPMGNAEGINLLKDNIATRNIAYNEMIEDIQGTVLRSRHPILLRGAEGAGKTAMARRLHELKARTALLTDRFVEVNCMALKGMSAMPAMSALFGHKGKALLGVTGAPKSELQLSNNDMLFLDNIDELGLPEQAMLLQAMEDRVYTPLGSGKPVKCDFQLIAATNKDLEGMVRNGQFRADLLARLSTWEFRLPSLQERPEDIEPNLVYELKRSTNTLPHIQRFSAKALRQYLAFALSNEAPWLANFRDLSASVERMITRSVSEIISEEVVGAEITTLRAKWSSLGFNDHVRLGRKGSPSPVTGATDNYVAILLPDHNLNLFEQNQLDFVIRVAMNCPSYAELSRRLYGDDLGINPAQKSRSYLLGYGLSLDMIKEKLGSAS
ncbi:MULTISPECIES: RNA repair transcriptional activator RtcR family protein [unclassified Pseudomonas]|uniref:RNA repair transcriptional activator RtcR family protein n=1 Tax=unclassified Pseudomonas TaxID=196821 RepID=UPI00186859FB|nr:MULTISPECIES: RNA repair transcriptional activator RtcR family protein [unclassified Pseudomonas]